MVKAMRCTEHETEPIDQTITSQTPIKKKHRTYTVKLDDEPLLEVNSKKKLYTCLAKEIAVVGALYDCFSSDGGFWIDRVDNLGDILCEMGAIEDEEGWHSDELIEGLRSLDFDQANRLMYELSEEIGDHYSWKRIVKKAQKRGILSVIKSK
jgi:hypothetical protein